MPIDPLDLVKAKYTRRTGSPGNYRYYYDEPGKGPQQGGPVRAKQASNPVTLPRASLLGLLSQARGGMSEGEMLWHMNHADTPDNSKHLRDQLGVLIKQGKVRQGSKDGKAYYFAKAAATVSDEIRHLMRDKNYPQDRAVAAALEMERRGKIKKMDGEDESDEEDEETDEEEDVQKARIDPLDLVKHEPPPPERLRIGSVTYHIQGPHELRPEQSRRSMRKAWEPAPIILHEDPIDLVTEVARMGAGRLVAPNGRGGNR